MGDHRRRAVERLEDGRVGLLMVSIETVSAVRKPGSNRDEAIALRRNTAAQISSSVDGEDLHTDQGTTGASRPRVLHHLAAKRANRIEPRGLQRRHQREQPRRGHRRDHQEESDPPISGGDAEIDVAEIHRHGPHAQQTAPASTTREIR